MFMLLSCFAFVYSTACAVEEPRTPRKGRSSVVVLQESPDTLWQKKDKSLRVLSAAETRPVNGKKRGQMYTLYAALHLDYPTPSSEHMTACDTLMDETQKDGMWRKLCQLCSNYEEKTGQDKRTICSFVFPCAAGLVQHRDPDTGIVSPSHTLETAFNNSAASILNWIETGERSNGSPVVSEVLSGVIDNSQYGHKPAGHTQQKAVAGVLSKQLYQWCLVEIAVAPSWKIRQMKKKRSNTMSKLTEWLSKTGEYLQSNLEITPKQLNEINGIQRAIVFPKPENIRTKEEEHQYFKKAFVPFVNQDIDQIIAEAYKIILQKKEQPVADPLVEQSYTQVVHVLDAIKFVGSYYKTLYQELMDEPLLRGAFITVGPNIPACQKVASLWLTALQREACPDSCVRKLF